MVANIFDEQEQKIAEIRHQAEERGDTTFFENIIRKVEELSNQWDELDLSRNEHAVLIKSKHDLLKYIERIKNGH